MQSDRQRWDVGGLATCVYDTGPAEGRPTIVMVHGGDPRSLASALDWSSIWSAETLGARLVAYDKPGQGRSYAPDLPDRAMGAAGLCDHLDAVVDRVGPGPVVLMGHSRGALPVAEVALRRPDRIAGLVLVSSNTLAPPSPETPADFYPNAYANPPARPTIEFVRREPELNSHLTGHVDELVPGRLAAASENGWWSDLDRRTRVYDTIVKQELENLRTRVLAEIERRGFDLPVLQIWGQNDVSAPVSLAHALFRTIAARTADCASVVVNRTAHYVYREHPSRFLAVLRTFVQELTPRVRA
ncbi:alpha/beta fold hydrolase [Jiangella muralis]|uniref:alpha/beta fold hydrolase n=1 Tax=Jiangella muralis TaxID=702383 RepID=UPI00069FDCA7|nr:alpha/beta hydrolase [Jiangella muralis]